MLYLFECFLLQFLHLIWVAFLWEIIMSLAELTWGLQGKSVQASRLYHSRQRADQPHCVMCWYPACPACSPSCTHRHIYCTVCFIYSTVTLPFILTVQLNRCLKFHPWWIPLNSSAGHYKIKIANSLFFTIKFYLTSTVPQRIYGFQIFKYIFCINSMNFFSRRAQ